MGDLHQPGCHGCATSRALPARGLPGSNLSFLSCDPGQRVPWPIPDPARSAASPRVLAGTEHLLGSETPGRAHGVGDQMGSSQGHLLTGSHEWRAVPWSVWTCTSVSCVPVSHGRGLMVLVVAARPGALCWLLLGSAGPTYVAGCGSQDPRTPAPSTQCKASTSTAASIASSHGFTGLGGSRATSLRPPLP